MAVLPFRFFSLALSLFWAITEAPGAQFPKTAALVGAVKIIKEDCDFVDSWVSNLALRGILIAYKKYIYENADIADRSAKDGKKKK